MMMMIMIMIREFIRIICQCANGAILHNTDVAKYQKFGTWDSLHKAKFHYAISSQTGSKLVADLQRAEIWGR